MINLNEKQQKAVNNINGPLLVLAGAGSGKTRVIISRIINMLKMGITQSSILALTFTNKAANEMLERIKNNNKKKLSNLTICTFHAFGVKILKNDIDKLGYKKNFCIYDAIDKQTLIKETAKDLKLKPEEINTYELSYLFSQIKTGRKDWNAFTEQYKELFSEYQTNLKIYNSLDFDDLILLPIKIFTEYPDILEKYKKKFKYFLVDEFQDTSEIQYLLIKLLASDCRNICVVGDDDQSIYSWRGACFENILNFENDFNELEEIRLEQNYRSTDKILRAANELISNNQNRKPKKLWTNKKKGELLKIIMPENEKQEGEIIAEKIKNIKLKTGILYKDFGILVRTNSLTRSIEEALLLENLPYKVSGGMSFFQRKEVKDIIAYLRIIANPDDDVNFLRIVNLPHRGLGKRTIEQLTIIARAKSFSLFSAASAAAIAADSPFSNKLKQALNDFVTLINYYRTKLLSGRKMAKSLLSLIEHIDYWGYLVMEYKKANTAKWKYMNTENLVNSLSEYEKNPDNLNPSIFDYLNRITLFSKEDNEEKNNNDKINLMTIHSAKGLEFDTVFIAGAEKDIIPHIRTLEENEENLEEERRLFYVAITRAKNILYISSCKSRNKRGKREETGGPSQFLEEIPDNLYEFIEDSEIITSQDAESNFGKLKNMFKE